MDITIFNKRECCRKHNKELCFLKFDQEGQYAYECIACDIRQENKSLTHKILLDDIQQYQEDKSNIIYNWPPLASNSIYDQLQTIIDSGNSDIDQIVHKINTFKSAIIDSIDKVSKKIIIKLSIKDKLQNLYDDLSQRKQFSTLVEKLPENNKELASLIVEQIRNMKENTTTLENTIQDHLKYQQVSIKEIEKLQENIVSQIERVLEKEEIDLSEEASTINSSRSQEDMTKQIYLKRDYNKKSIQPQQLIFSKDNLTKLIQSQNNSSENMRTSNLKSDSSVKSVNLKRK